MTGKERAVFRAAANSLKPEFQIGKDGISDNLISQTEDSFRTKELIKIKVLTESAPGTPREFADALSEKTGSEVIQVIGGVIVLYRKNPDLGKDKEKKKAAVKTKPLAKVKAKRAAAAKREKQKKEEKRNAISLRGNYAKSRPAGRNQGKKGR
jgi:RNA-binding protein